MAKGRIGMVLAPEYSDNKKKKEEKKGIETIPLSFRSLIEPTKMQLFQLHQTSFRIGQDSLVYGRCSMIPVAASLNLLHYH